MAAEPVMPGASGKWTKRALVGGGMAVAGLAVAGVGVLASRRGGALLPGKSRARPVAGDERLPAAVDVVVVGGGNIGCMTALTLAERGIKVALCEKGVVAGEASGRSLGYVDSLFLDPVKMEIVARSKALWPGMNDRLGADTGYRRTGVAALFQDDEALGQAGGWLEGVRGMPGEDARMLSSAEVAALAKGASTRFAGGLYSPSDAVAEPQLAASAMADQIRKLGGTVHQNCAVRGVETAAGRISGVVTEKGVIACSAVVVAGGVWSPVLARSLGLDLPQFMAFGTVARTVPVRGDAPDTSLVLTQSTCVMRRNLAGGIDFCKGTGVAPITPSTIANAWRLKPAIENMLGQLEPVFNLKTFLSQWRIPSSWALDGPSPFERNRILMPETRDDLVDGMKSVLAETFPGTADAPVVERWAGALMSTTDNMPVISAVQGHPGLYIGSGFYYGLTMAPAAGEALADLVMGNKPKIDLNLYRFSRFSDGSPTVFRA